ncbi:hypothetical protein [Flavitalea sp.]|nr:hypothetical protein [Flavitalea sp.]
MILVLDACTISNLLHIVQDNSLIKLLDKSFENVFITKEVIAEFGSSKFVYLSYYDNSRETLNQLISDLHLSDYVSELDSIKYECIPFVRNFAIVSGQTLKESDGEFQSALLSLYLSRWGENDFMENSNRVLFATDDGRANTFFIELFLSNQIGTIIDSIDILCIFYLKGLITKKHLLKNVDAILGLYSSPLNELKQTISRIKERDIKGIFQSYLTNLLDMLYENQLESVFDTLHEGGYKKMYADFPKLKDLIRKLSVNGINGKAAYVKSRYDFISNNLLWDGHLGISK